MPRSDDADPRTLDASDIVWDSSRVAVPRRDRIHRRLLEALTREQLIALVEDLQDDVMVRTAIVQESMHALQHVTAQRDRLRLAIRRPRP